MVEEVSPGPPYRTGAWALALLLAGPGCGYDGELPTTPSPSAPASQAEIELSLSPSPVDAVVATAGGDPWSAAWTLTLRETAGVGGDVEMVRATLTDSSGASIAATELDVDELREQLGGSNHLGGGNNLALPMNLNFDFPADALSGNLHVDLQLSDDRGNTVSAGVDDVVHVCIPAQLAPDDAATLDNGCTNRSNGFLWEFDWSDCEGAEVYEFYLKLESEDEPIDPPDLTTSEFTVLEDRVVPEQARFGWSWKVRAQLNGVWGDWSPERTFVVEPANTDCVTP